MTEHEPGIPLEAELTRLVSELCRNKNGRNTAFIRNPNYHQAGDTVDTLDFGKMAVLVEMLEEGIRGMMHDCLSGVSWLDGTAK